MRTQRQIESSRQNGAKSRGPRTPEGKQISSQNSFKTGLYSAALVTLREKQGDFETLRDEYYQHHSPQTPEEREILDTLIGLAWQLRRYAQVETQTWNLEIKRAELDFPDDLAEGNLCGAAFFGSDQRFARLHRMQAATQRQFKDTLHELERLKAARLETAQLIEEETTSPDLGFVPSHCGAGASAPPSGFCPAQSSSPGRPFVAASSLALPDHPEFVPSTEKEQAVSPADAGEAHPNPIPDAHPIPAFPPVLNPLSDKIEVNP